MKNFHIKYLKLQHNCRKRRQYFNYNGQEVRGKAGKYGEVIDTLY